MKALKITALFGSAAIGIYLGFRIEEKVLWVLYEHPFGYDTFFPFPMTWALHQFHHFLIGVITSALTISCSRLLKFPDIAAIAVIFIASIPYSPLFEVLRYGESLSIQMVRGVIWFQAGYFVGMFAILGVLFFATKFVAPLLRRKNT